MEGRDRGGKEEEEGKGLPKGWLTPPMFQILKNTLCVQPELLEKFRYRSDLAVSTRTHLVAELSLYKDQDMLSRLGFPLRTFTQSESYSQLVFATAADESYIRPALDAIARIQSFFPNVSIYLYDLSNGSPDDRADKVSKLC